MTEQEFANKKSLESSDDYDKDIFVAKLLAEIGNGLTVRGPDVRRLRDATVRGMLAGAKVEVVFDDEDDYPSVDLYWT